MMFSRPVLRNLLLAVALLFPAVSDAAPILDDAVAHEKAAVAGQCKAATYGGDFARVIDFNNDGLDDVITNLGAVNCDGVDGKLCGEVGCPHNFYVGVAEGGFVLIGSADLYGYELKKRYGNLVFEMRANAVTCKRDDGEYCIITTRVRGLRFDTISKR
ncbi:hypothetical protein OCK02_09355 [Rhizobium sp. TRM96647]|uniref:hypothetical protein n=1 Tax=unclassified Rhizobium TaxID=2613769 RepID=UPI0021E72DC2|nr:MULTISPECIES: hypothetical protein [unclassified Rhizobium]MCV3736410.1 hypothetical protein [Rhizobium sp. TRM96647]MCV3758779.1 hypothetical protein [Rhizobium sp. TRM96650]